MMENKKLQVPAKGWWTHTRGCTRDLVLLPRLLRLLLQRRGPRAVLLFFFHRRSGHFKKHSQ